MNTLATFDAMLSYVAEARRAEDASLANLQSHELADAQQSVDDLTRQIAELQASLADKQETLTALPARHQQEIADVAAKRQSEDADFANARAQIASTFPDQAS